MAMPKLACCNFMADPAVLRDFALDHGFDGVDWTFNPQNMPRHPSAESDILKALHHLRPLEVRYHCAFPKTDLGDADSDKAKAAFELFRRVCLLVSRLRGRVLTIHIGLGRNSTNYLQWEGSVDRLADLVRVANGLGVRLCLENLGWGWTSRPELFEKLVRKSGAWATLDIGHARISPSVESQQFTCEDFITPQPERFLNAHIYHEEIGDSHLAPEGPGDLEDRLNLLMRLPLCDWWVLEIREEEGPLKTLSIVRDFLASNPGG